MHASLQAVKIWAKEDLLIPSGVVAEPFSFSIDMDRDKPAQAKTRPRNSQRRLSPVKSVLKVLACISGGTCSGFCVFLVIFCARACTSLLARCCRVSTAFRGIKVAVGDTWLVRMYTSTRDWMMETCRRF
jgi:hypothetical protein